MDFPVWERVVKKAADERRSVNASILVLIDKWLES